MLLTRPPADPKHSAFVDVARDLFFAQGYGATSMSSVAAKVGGSKTTLWAHFPSKEALFAGVVDDTVERYRRLADLPLDASDDARDTLRRFGAGLMGVTLSPAVLALHRLVVAEAGRFPEIGAAYHGRGPDLATTRLAAWVAAAIDTGTLRPGDPSRAASQFTHMCQSGAYQSCLYGAPTPSADTIAADIEAAVDSFMRGWGC